MSQDNLNAEQLRETFKAMEADNVKLKAQMTEAESKLAVTEKALSALTTSSEKANSEMADKLKAEMETLADELSDLRTKAMNVNYVPDSNKAAKDAVRKLVIKSINHYARTKSQGDVFSHIESFSADVLKSANITTPADGGLAVANTLAMDIGKYLERRLPLWGLLGKRGSLTRNYTRLVRVTHSATRRGKENKTLETQAVTETAKYATTQSNVFKIEAQPLFSTELMNGTDVDVYNDIISDIAEEMSEAIASDLYFGTTAVDSPKSVADANHEARGIIGSRIDFGIGGKSYLPSKAATVGAARNPEIYPVYPTGAEGAVGADDKTKADFWLKFLRQLPAGYRPDATIIMAEETLSDIELLRDTTGKPVFEIRYSEAGDPILKGKRIVIDDRIPLASEGGAFAIYGDLSRALFVKEGEGSEMVVDPFTNKGSTIIYYAKEIIEQMGISDALIVAVAVTGNE